MTLSQIQADLRVFLALVLQFSRASQVANATILVCLAGSTRKQARRREAGGSRASNEPPLEVNNGGLKTQTVDFQLLANSGGMENKL